MSRLSRLARVCTLAFAGTALPLASVPSQAADVDGAPAPRRNAAARPYVLDPRCRIVPQPELSLYGETARFRPTMICMSRGIFADSFAPYPFYSPYYQP